MVTISGGEISEEKGSTISFNLKCELCGELQYSKTRISLTNGLTDIFIRKCPSCNNNQIIKIKYTV